MPRPFWLGIGALPWGATDPEEEKPPYGAPKTLQDGLLQIGSQACHILVQRVDSAAAEAIRKHERRPSSPRHYKDRNHLHPRDADSIPPDPDQYVVLLPHSSTAGNVAATAVSTPSKALPSRQSPSACDSRRSFATTTSRDHYEEESEQWGSYFLLGSNDVHTHHSSKWKSKGWCKPSCIPITVILVLIVLVVLLPLLDQADVAYISSKPITCTTPCRMSLAESIPEGLTYPPKSPQYPSTYEIWSDLLNISTSSIHIASLYWSLRGADIYPHPSADQGEDIFNKLVDAAERNVKVRIAQNAPSRDMPSTDTEELEKKGLAEVRSLNFARLIGGGVLHTKFWIVDEKHVYIGSANMDWRSLTQVKEMGAVIYDCPCIAMDLMKVFNVYWDLGKESAVVPSKWPDSYATQFNIASPMNISFNGVQGNAFLSSSPPPFSPPGRTGDSDAIVSLISKAEKFIYIAVMDYIPLIIYSPRVKFWPVLDNALRVAAIDRKVNVRLLVSKWNHTRKAELKMLRSLTDITDSYNNVKIEVKLFSVPATPDQQKIPFARVNHNKYMVTDNSMYIGTSNWSGDYFTDTAGVGLVLQPQETSRKRAPFPLRGHLQGVFERDWNSPYAKYLEDEIGIM